jgi:serine/threonine protein kinase
MLVPIAAGGMASVWAARLRGAASFQKVVAIKTMLPELAVEPEYRAMFLDEARVASKLRHPNVCEAFDLGEEDGALFLAMEWIDGASLHRVLRGGEKVARPIAPALAARIVAGACAGLHAAHEAADDDGSPLAIVHRDVSPQNILVSIDGHVKVADFGIAKAHGKSHATQAGQAKGKLAYMAPEQLRGQAVDRRADVFALGCVLYEITTGKKPFDGEHDAQIMQAILQGAPVRPSELVPGYPLEVERIIARAMAKDPRQRFASAEGLRLALERWTGSASDRDLATLVHERCGAELEQRRTAIQHALAGEPSQETKPRPSNEAGRRTMFVGALVIALGFGSLLWKREVAPVAPPAPGFVATSVALPEAPPIVPPPTNTAPSRQDEIRFTVEPPEASLVVDGETQEPGILTVARPEPSAEPRIVLVKAPGYVDRLFLVDASTSEEVEARLVAEVSVLP